MPEPGQRYHILSYEELSALLAFMADCCFLSHCPATSRCFCFLRAGRLGAKHQLGWDLKSDLQYPRDGKSPREITSFSGLFQRCWSAKASPPSYRTQPVCQVAQGAGLPSKRSVDSWYHIEPICQRVISIAEDDMIKEMGVNINYFLLRIYSLCWILAPLMN